MKTLLVLRHGKSSWSDPLLDDFDRPLKKKGKRAAERMALELRDRGLLPDFALCSAARRARQTLERFRKATGWEGPAEEKKKLYFTSPGEHFSQLAKVEDVHERVLLIGHNPDLEEVLERLVGEAVDLPAAGLAVVDLDISSWRDVGEVEKANLRLALRPKDLPDRAP